MTDFFWNTSGLIYQSIEGWNNNVTGSLFLTFFFLLVLFIVMAFIFHMSIDLIWLITLPMVILITAYNPIFFPVASIWIIYLGFIIFRLFRSGISGY